MNRKYRFYCNGCDKPDKDFPDRFTIYPKVTEHRWCRRDTYAIFTGIYCDECYESGDSSLYPYRKDSYAQDLEHGEHIYPEEERY